MRHRLAWLSTAPLMFGGLLAGHALGYRLAFSDPHSRADALSHSGHSYFSYLPFALTVWLTVPSCTVEVSCVPMGSDAPVAAGPNR